MGICYQINKAKGNGLRLWLEQWLLIFDITNVHTVKWSSWVADVSRLPIQSTHRLLQRVSVCTLEVSSQSTEGVHVLL